LIVKIFIVLSQMVEAAGIEPASAIRATSSHSQVYLILGFRFKISKNLRLACAFPTVPGHNGIHR